MKPIKDAKGGGGGQWSGSKQQGTGPSHSQTGGRPHQAQGGHGPLHQS